ncbi:hypothetical protein BG000_010868 [Podila horticola]|nr:hypothetical protein BG000_010868 [Podila horticola]
MYPSGKQSQPECIDVTQFSTNSINHKSTHHNDTSGASKLHARNNLLRCIETNRGRFQHEQQGLIGQSLGHTHSEQQHDFQNLLHTRTPLILGASPAELSVYPDSHQYARKQSKRLSTQPYIFSNGCKDISISSEMALQATTKAMSSLLITAEEQPSSEKDVKYGRGDIDQEQKDKEDTELTRLCRRRCISTSEAEPLSPILPPSSSVALRHQASRRLSCGGRLETYLETEQDRATVRDKGKGGRWPCKLRPLIKKSTLLDIHTTLRRNLKLPANHFIDIEFQWQGNTYMILDATHWMWAREQVNHGDMTIRCNIWQKRYTR